MDFEAGVASVSAFMRREAERRAIDTSARKAHLRALLPALRKLLYEAGARAVWVFGSLAERPGWGAPHAASDLDLAVAGLPSKAFLDAESRLRLIAGEPIDLVRLEDAPVSLSERILADGELVP